MRSFTIIVCLLVLLAAIIRADDDGSSPRKARRPGKARSSLQGYHAKLLREKFKKPIKKAENTRADETRVKNIQVYKPGQALRKAPRLSPAEMQRLVEEKQRVLKQRKKEHQKEGKQDGSRAASSSITDRRTSLTRDAALRQVRALHQDKVLMMEKRVLEALDLFCNQNYPRDHEQCAKMVNEYDLGDDNGKIQIDTKIRSKVRQRLQEGTKDQYEKKKVETIERFDAKHRQLRKPKNN